MGILYVILFQVANGSANLTMGALGTTVERTELFATSGTHLVLSMHFAHSGGVPLTSIRRIFMPFSFKIWLFTIGSIVFMTAILCLNKRMQMARANCPEYNAAILEVFGTFLGLPLTKKALGHSIMLGLIFWLFATFFLRNVYLGSLFTLLTDQVNGDPVDTIERVIEQNYTVYCTPGTCELFNKTMPRIRQQ